MKRAKILTALAKAGREACEQNELLVLVTDELIEAKGEIYRLKARIERMASELEDAKEARWRLNKFSAILSDLDRCRHGRHEGDGCFSCPDGISAGNPITHSDQPLGWDISAREIRYPGRDRKHDPDAWGSER